MDEEYLQEQIITQIEVLAEELGGTLKRSTQNYRGRISKVISIEYDVHDM
tara:strand:- start:110 stop:259 length:150 start_codon:yes stop_codon:yes gene_type:complete